MSILIVEDDEKVASGLVQGLTEAGYDPHLSRTAEEALTRLAGQSYGLVVLDLGLPGMSGMDVLGQMRDRGNSTPVIILTARDAVNDRVDGFEAGADDYMVKPFAFPELVARIRTRLRGSQGSETAVFQVGSIQINLLKREVHRDGQVIELTPREFDLLAYLGRHPDQVVTRDMLAQHVWKVKSRMTSLDNVIDVHVSHLREKIDKEFEPKLLQTIRGVGLVLKTAR